MVTIPRESWIYLIPAAICWIVAAVPLAASYLTADGTVPYFGLQGSVPIAILGGASLWLIGRKYPAIAPYPAMMVGALMTLKPLLAPIMFLYENPPAPFPLFSETHLYFILPGAALVAAGFVYLLKKQEP